MLQCVCSLVDHSWRQSVVRTKTWRSEPCDLDVTISASCDWSVAIFTTSLETQESYLTLRNLILQTCLSITRDFFRLHSTFARPYNAAASPASRLRSAGSLAKSSPRCEGKTESQLLVTAEFSTSLKLLLLCSAIDEKHGNDCNFEKSRLMWKRIMSSLDQ